MSTKYLSDLEIAQNCQMRPIAEIAANLGLSENNIELYGKYKAKIHLNVLEQFKDKANGKVILVTAINPTPAGEGKSTTTVGLGQAFEQIGKKAIIALREPAFGPVMGIKGGAAGGGHAQVVPMEDINLHFTGDFHAITAATNAIAAMLDNHLHQGNKLNIDPRRIVWKRALDMNDRALRNVTIGLGGHTNGIPREDHFQITVASEIMAVFCIATSLSDLKARISRIVIAYTYDRTPVTVADIDAAGVCALILRDALAPNLVQTLENTPALIHGGPFANIAHGCNSIIATSMARKLADYVITEAGFGADLGAEKFLNIKARIADIKPSAVVIVATIRALKMQGGMKKEELQTESVKALLDGMKNLEKHIETVQAFGLPYVVAINKFVTDTELEIKALHEWAETHKHPVALSEVWEHGGKGGMAVAEKVIEVIETMPNNFKHLYDLNDSIEDKITKIARTAYGAKDVEFTSEAKVQLNTIKKNGWDKLAVCMAKTPVSLSDNPKLLGRPEGFTITVRELTPSVGAGFIVALTGDIMTMPGLPATPSAVHMDVAEDGSAVGLF
ncbi:MAG: formate--tetrahydrofolate ligase [Mangrovibacterium sp.]